MAYVILRHGKLSTQTQAAAATAHNYRQYDVSNADQDSLHKNVEFVNVDERDYWELASERITEAGITPRRKDAVRCVEIILSASPEWFERDSNGRAKDYSQSDWLKDTRAYLTEKYGEKNVIGFQLQQDERTPHIHAIIVPITLDGRLSARDLFNPKTLRNNQTEYAEVMQSHGLERGIEYSKAKHQPMKRFYGQQGQTAAELGVQLGPASSYQDVQVANPGHLVANPEKWAGQQSQVINDQARTQVDAANQRAEKAQNLALENAAAKDLVRVLQKQLSTVQRLKQASEDRSDELARRLAGGEAPPTDVVARGNSLLNQDRDQVRTSRWELTNLHSKADQAAKTNDYGRAAELLVQVSDQESKNKALEADLARFAGGRLRLTALDEEPGRIAAAQAKTAIEQAAQADRARIAAQQAEAMRVIKHELSLMDRTMNHWKIPPGKLTACIIVPKENAERVAETLRVSGKSYAAVMSTQGEPHRTDGQATVYVHYEPSSAHFVGAYFDRVRAGGGQVHEHADIQTRREQLQAQPQPQPKTQERKQELAPNKDFGIGG